MQSAKTFTLGHYSTATSNPINVNKYKTMLEQSNTWRTSSNQQYFQNGTDRYSNENKDLLEQIQGIKGEQQQSEKENNKYFLSQYSKKNKTHQDQNLINSSQNPFSFTNDQEESHLHVKIKSPQKKIANQLAAASLQFAIDYKTSIIDTQNSNPQITSSQKQKNLQELLKTEVEKETNKSTGQGESISGNQNMIQLKVNDFFQQKKSLSPRKIIKDAQQDQSPSNRHQISERKPIISSPDIQNSKSFENIFNNQSSIQKFASFHSNIQAFTSNQRLITNNNCNGSLSNSFQVKNDFTQNTNIDNKQTHYFAQDQDSYANCTSAKKSQSSSLNLAGSIIGLKKPKKKCDSQFQSNLHSTQDSEISLIKMENINLKNQNQVLTMKNETLEKEKKHYKNICTKKQQECEQLNEQINQLKNQIDQMKVQAKLASNSQENTPVQRIQQQTQPSPQTIMSLDTPRQLTSNINSNAQNQNSQSPHFQRGNQSFALQAYQATQMMQQQNIRNGSNSNFNTNIKLQQQVQPNLQVTQTYQQQSNQQQQQHSQILQYSQIQQQEQQQQINMQQYQLIQQKQEQLLQKQNQIQLLKQSQLKYQQQKFESDQFSLQINTQSPQKNNSSIQIQCKQSQNLSPIVNYEERSDFVSNSILEDIPTQSQVRTINNSLIQNSNVNDEFEIIQNEYNQDNQKIDNQFINIQCPQNMKF